MKHRIVVFAAFAAFLLTGTAAVAQGTCLCGFGTDGQGVCFQDEFCFDRPMCVSDGDCPSGQRCWVDNSCPPPIMFGACSAVCDEPECINPVRFEGFEQCEPPPIECEDPGAFPQCNLPCPVPTDVCVPDPTGAPNCRCQPPSPVECEDVGGFPQCDLPCPIANEICVPDPTGAPNCRCEPPAPAECEDPGAFPQCDLPCPDPNDRCEVDPLGGDLCRCLPPPTCSQGFCESDPGIACDRFPQDPINCGTIDFNFNCIPFGFPQCDLPCPVPGEICVPDPTGAPSCLCEPPPPVDCEDPGAFPQCDLACPVPGEICVPDPTGGPNCLCEPPPPVDCEDPGVFPQCDLACPVPGEICVPDPTGAPSCLCEPPPPVECEDAGAFPQCDLACPVPGDICVPDPTGAPNCLCEPPPPVECEDPGAFPQCDLPCPVPGDICVPDPTGAANCLCEPPPPVECEDPGAFPQCDLPCPVPTDICVPDPTGAPSCVCETPPPPEGACCRNGPGIETDCFITTEDDCMTNHLLFVGPGSECTEEIDCRTLVVTLDSVSAKATPAGVMLRWSTAMEIDTIGFRVLRQTAGTREKVLSVVTEFMPSVGHGLSGASYYLLDDARASALATHYYLEDIDIDGRVTRHGPFAVDRGVRADRPTRVAPER